MSNDDADRAMPRYQCHKKVWALQIESIHRGPEATVIYPIDHRYGPIPVDADYLKRHNPAVGGYFVVYDDGYKSFSPAKAFEEGYTLIGAEPPTAQPALPSFTPGLWISGPSTLAGGYPTVIADHAGMLWILDVAEGTLRRVKTETET